VAAFSTALSGFRFPLKKLRVFVPYVIYYGRPGQFALIRFNARRLDDSASVFVSHSLKSRVSHLKESELYLTASLLRYPNRKASIKWVWMLRQFAIKFDERDTDVGLNSAS